jgi:hypothetical protein
LCVVRRVFLLGEEPHDRKWIDNCNSLPCSGVRILPAARQEDEHL